MRGSNRVSLRDVRPRPRTNRAVLTRTHANNDDDDTYIYIYIYITNISLIALRHGVLTTLESGPLFIVPF